MSDRLYTYPLDSLLKWILKDLKEEKVFGISRSLFFTPSVNDPFRLRRYGHLLETPLGVAAGPHTQLSHNIILSWLMGARYIELKTVQTLDELEVSKPCIDMTDEGYNCEWSQELKVQQSFDEYLNAWIIIHILKDLFKWPMEEAGFIFNLSVGYNLEGIKKLNVQWFFEKMNDCSDELNKKNELISQFYPRIKELNIPACLSDNITLSTMHGCPPYEIESIVEYLIVERNLHTAVKLNPTLLGPLELRSILNKRLEYENDVPDKAFEHDIKWEEATGMIKRLTALAKENNLHFGLKLTNTLETKNASDLLPKEEEMVYLSGRALHPISINLASKLQNQFEGKLDISFSAGVDAFNIVDTLTCNLSPITVCSDLLKPGGYTRLAQYFTELQKEFDRKNAKSIEQFVLTKHNQTDLDIATIVNLQNYATQVLRDERYKKSSFKYENIKTKRELTVYDCIYSPCIESCAISQDVPEYMYHTATGNFEKAFEIILKTNPLPNTTGMVCDHLCQAKCTRLNYDSPLLIREIKRFIAENQSKNFLLKPKPSLGIKAAVIGAGPAGLSASYFLALEGVEVHVYESKSFAGGMASDAIPVFRIDQELLKQDVKNIESLGVTFHFEKKLNKNEFSTLRTEFDYIFIAIGAQMGKKLNIEGESLPQIFDQLTFLSDVLNGTKHKLGKKIAIVGGGLSAVDAARTANRLKEDGGKVTVLYRRTKNEMPCGREEVDVMIEERIEISELVIPESIEKDNERLRVCCSRMKLGKLDSSGRRRPEKIEGSEYDLYFDSVISAIGQDIRMDFFPDKEIVINLSTLETQIKNVFAGGDAVRGADSLINAMADGQKVAQRILNRIEKELDLSIVPDPKLTEIEFQRKLATRIKGGKIPSIPLEKRASFKTVHPTLTKEQAQMEADRCLYCNDICNICVTVCPNLSNVSVKVEPVEIIIPHMRDSFVIDQAHQIINIGDFCNECGNCTTFCPTNGDPYRTKPTVYLSKESFEKEEDCYFVTKDSISYKKNGYTKILHISDKTMKYVENENHIILGKEDFNVIEIEEGDHVNFDFTGIIELKFMHDYLKDHPLLFSQEF